MDTAKSKRAEELRKELVELEAEVTAERKAKHVVAVEALVKNMSYDEMCEVREILNEKISSQYAYESDE